VAGIPVADDGAGVVVFHVPRSRMAPHRHTVTKECYIRRADRTEKMTMREIQDLTLQVERGLAAIERQFEERQKQFASQFKSFPKDDEYAFGLRATLMPLTPIYIDRVHGNNVVSPPSHTLWATIGNSKPYGLGIWGGSADWRPLVRGTANRHRSNRLVSSREVHCDGLIEYLVMHPGKAEAGVPNAPLFYLPIQLVMGLFGNALCAAERFRRASGAPDVEYGLEFEIANLVDLPIGKYGGVHFGETLGPFPPETIFPRYSIGPADEFQGLSQTFERDFWNGAGHDFSDLATVDFERALRELGIVTDATAP
jgi:hypothetical protein